MTYEQTPIRTSRKKDLLVISEMSSAKVLNYLAYRHRVGLLAISTAVMAGYIAYDKVLHIFI